MVTTQLRFKPISSVQSDGTGGQRDVAIDFTDVLEVSESLSDATVTSSDPSVLAISNDQWNPFAITKEDGSTIAVGKGVQFSMTTLAEVRRDVLVDIVITGDSGTRETYEVMVPIVRKR